MLSERLRSRLAQLNREPLPPALVKLAHDASHPRQTATSAECVIEPVQVDLLGSAGREIETPYGKHWLMERPLTSIWDRADELIARSLARFSQGRSPSSEQHSDWAHFARRFPRESVFLDLETCGFAGSMVFLVGVIHEAQGSLVLSQMLARNYAEEQAMLFTLWEIMSTRGTLLTFNGKSFDWPMVNDRSVLHRLDAAGHTRAIDHHIDLLHHARRQFKRELPNCRLQTLEWYLCGRRRAGDIPGSEIPDAYHQYVRTGQQSEMKSILHHNALDLVTLLQLSLRLAAPSA